MASSTRFRKLLEPGYIGSVRTKNRMLKTGAHAGFYDYMDGYLHERHMGYYEAIARGGAGLVTIGAAEFDPPLSTVPGKGYNIDDDKYIPKFHELTDLIHRHDCPAFLQIFHMGPMHPQVLSGCQPVSSSSFPEGKSPVPWYAVARELTITEIEDIVDKFASAAVRAKKAGFDGMELNGGCAHLLNSFLSRAWNKRQDTYGCGSLESRAKIMVDIIREMKRRNGQDFAVVALINGVEYGLEEGITSEESQGIAKILEKAGADAIFVRVEFYKRYKVPAEHLSTHFPDIAMYPEVPEDLGEIIDGRRHGEGAWVPPAAAIKKVVSIPVITIGRLGPEIGERILRFGIADFIGMNRRLMADHDLPNKVAAGQLGDIAPCTACHTCWGLNETGQPARCQVNAALGREREYEIEPAERKKKVMVVGGGPAGMEAARVLALRGHEVTLYEKEGQLGGSMPIAATVKGFDREDLLTLVRYLRNQIVKLGVNVRLGQQVSRSLIEASKPDALVIATGGVHNIPDLPGINRRNVVTSQDLHRRLKRLLKIFGPRVLRQLTSIWMPIGRKVVIMGGGIQGCQVAEFLVKRGRKVTIVDTADEIGEGLVQSQVKPSLLNWLSEKGAMVMSGVKYEEITDRGLTITTGDGQKQTLEADTIVTALTLIPNDELLKSLDGVVAEVYDIGDCREPHLIIDAIDDGSRVARAI